MRAYDQGGSTYQHLGDRNLKFRSGYEKLIGKGGMNMKIGNREFDLKNGYYIMGILNVTPDSFSDGGRYIGVGEALAHIEQMIEDGADIIDIGGESTKPGHEKISEIAEIDRVCPVIERIKREFDIPISLDTYKAGVAEAGISSGADMINDIWGLKWSEELAKAAGMKYSGDMASVVAKAGVPINLMHNRVNPNDAPNSSIGGLVDNSENVFGYGEDVVEEVISDLKDILKLAKESGISDDKIILDPGIGFGKLLHENQKTMGGLDRIAKLGYPILLGASRKSMIGQTLDLPVEEREEGTIATTVFGAMKGAHIFRVHDVKKNKRALKMFEAMK